MGSINPTVQPIDVFIRPKRFAEILGISKSTLYNMINDGRLPEPIKLGQKAQAWPLSQVNEVISNLKKAANI